MPDSVLDIIRRLSRTRSEDEIARVVSRAARILLKADGATFAVREGDHCYYVDEDAVSPLWKDRRLPMSGCVAGWCMTNREAAAISDIYSDPRIFTPVYRPTFVRSLAVAPVGLDEPVAALGAYWAERRQPQAEDLERLQAIADGAALAMASLQTRRARPPAAAPQTAPERAEPMERTALGRLSPRPAIEGFLHQGFRPNSHQAYAFALACVLVATLLRLGVGSIGLEGLAVFSLYYPTTLVAALAGGRWAGALAAVAGGLAADYFFMWPQHALWPVTRSDLVNLSLYATSCAAIILVIGGYQSMVSRLKLEDARHLTLARETQHRARNAVAVVESILRQSLRDAPDRARIINQRIRAVFADVEIRLRTRPTRIRSLLVQELELFDLTRLSFAGDGDVMVAPEGSSILTLAVHELATNALKYGALSVPAGRVTLTWQSSGGATVVRWCEAGGPPVEAPRKRGFGSVMLQRLVEAAGGAMVVQFPPTGAMAEISLPHGAASRSSAPRRPSPAKFPTGGIAEGLESQTPLAAPVLNPRAA